MEERIKAEIAKLKEKIKRYDTQSSDGIALNAQIKILTKMLKSLDRRHDLNNEIDVYRKNIIQREKRVKDLKIFRKEAIDLAVHIRKHTDSGYMFDRIMDLIDRELEHNHRYTGENKTYIDLYKVKINNLQAKIDRLDNTKD